MVAKILASRDTDFLIGVAVSDEQPVLREDQRKPFLGHPNTVDHPPQRFEAQFADEPARCLIEVG